MALNNEEKFVRVGLSSEEHRRLRQIAAATDEPMVKVANREMSRFIRSHPVARAAEEWERRAKK
jgi:hypothetical protein